MNWFDEKIDKIKGDRFLYKLICFLIGGPKYRMSYKEMYLLLYGLNRKSLGEKEAKKKSMNRILEIYKTLHNNNLPKNINYGNDW